MQSKGACSPRKCLNLRARKCYFSLSTGCLKKYERKCKWSDPTPLLSLTYHVNGKKGKKGNYKQRTRSVHGLHDSRLSPSPLRNIPSDEEQEESRLYTLAKGHTGI